MTLRGHVVICALMCVLIYVHMRALATDEELRSVGYTDRQLRLLRLPPEVRQQEALAAALAKRRPPPPTTAEVALGEEEREEGSGVEGPAVRRGRMLAIGGSVTYRSSLMTCEGQTTVTCADVEALPCAASSRAEGARVDEPGITEGGSFWEQVCPMTVARDGCAAAVCGERVYVTGGMDERDMDLDAVESCGGDGVWRREPFTTPLPVSFHASVSVGGRLYVLGGLGVERIMDQQCWRSSVYSLDLSAGGAGAGANGGGWVSHAPMLSKRAFLGAVAVRGRVYAVGGMSVEGAEPDYTKGIPGLMWDVGHGVVNTVESWDPREGVWRKEPSLRAVANYSSPRRQIIVRRGLQGAPGARAAFGLTAVQDCLFAIGGCDGEVVLDTVESWDVRGTSEWRLEPPLKVARANLGACSVGERVYAVGGWDTARDLPVVESFSLGARAWREETELSIPRSNLALAVLCP